MSKGTETRCYRGKAQVLTGMTRDRVHIEDLCSKNLNSEVGLSVGWVSFGMKFEIDYVYFSTAFLIMCPC